MLTAVADRKEIERAQNTLRDTVTRGIEGHRRAIGHKGGPSESSVYHLPEHGYWCCFDTANEDNRYWNAFGTTFDPDPKRQLGITVEINPAFDPARTRSAGLFARDATGVTYVLHNGRVGGGRQGIGRSAFLNFIASANQHPVMWPNGRIAPWNLIGRIDRTRIREQIGSFVRLVADFKAGRPGPIPFVPESRDSAYADEFAGSRKPYTITQVIEATCNHGPVIAALHEQLKAAGVGPLGKDIRRDLFVKGEAGVCALFEAKTSVTTSDIYSAVGQLMIHTAMEPQSPLRVMVLPEPPRDDTAGRLANLGIEVVTYERGKSGTTFDGLDTIIRRIKAVSP